MKHTHELEQYGIRYGRKVHKFKRMKRDGASYREPRFIGIECFKTAEQAKEFEQRFDKKIH